jgi:EAL domain-containing protein (putative c-di-GMP-specific phosphodiesterase class I)
MVEIFDTHSLRQDPVQEPHSGARSTRHAVTAFRRALSGDAVGVQYRLIWDLVDREVIAFDALPVVRHGVGGALGAAAVWPIAQTAGLVPDLVRAMRAQVEASQRRWERFGLVAPVSIAPVAPRSARQRPGRRANRPVGPPTVSIDLDPVSSHALFGLRADRSWRVHVPAEDAAAELRRVVSAGAVPGPVRLSAPLVHRFAIDANRLRLVARCVEAARHHDLVVRGDGADDGETVRGLLALGCHEASGAGLGADLLASQIPTLRWVSPTLRSPSARPLRVVAG